MSLLSDCLSHWKLDETSTTAPRADDKGVNPLTANDFPSSATGLLGNALSQAASGTSYLANSSATGIPTGSNPVSFSAWVKGTSFGAYSAIIAADDSANAGAIYLACGNSATGSTRFFFQSVDGSGHSAFVTAETLGLPSTGTWYHVVGTFDPSLGSNQLKIYVNGTLDSQASYSFGLPTSPIHLGVGCLSESPTDPNGRWDGLIDEVAVFTAALTASQVTTLYNGGSPLPFSSWGGLTPGGVAAPYFRGISTGGGLSPRGVAAGGGL